MHLVVVDVELHWSGRFLISQTVLNDLRKEFSSTALSATLAFSLVDYTIR